ncbi:hypothetical protein BJX99DRAFT_259331 [Aspergillus californicus]
MASNGDRHLRILITSAIFPCIACSFVILRCYVRGWVVKAFGWDDGFMVMAMLFHLIFSMALIVSATYGLGRKDHLWYFAFRLVSALASLCIRVSIALFLKRITVIRAHVRTIYFTLGLTVVSIFAVIIMLFVQCKPLSYAWTRMAFDQRPGICYDWLPEYIAWFQGSTTAVCDCILSILPILIVRKLQMGKCAKIAASCILGLAGLASASAIARMVLLALNGIYDEFYESTSFVILTSMETTFGIIAGSLPSLGPLILRYFGCSPEEDGNATLPDYHKAKNRRFAALKDSSGVLTTVLATETQQSTFRPENLAFTVEVQTRHSLGGHAHEQLSDQERVDAVGSYLGIYRAYDMAQSSHTESALNEKRA